MVKAYLKELFGPVEELDPYDMGLGIFWGTNGAREIANHVWDTDVPAVTNPWPDMEPTDLREAVAWLSSRQNTEVLYRTPELDELLNPKES